jgi:hypothetical protein
MLFRGQGRHDRLSRLPEVNLAGNNERGFARAMPRHFLDAAPNSRDRPLAFNIVAFVAEVNVWEEVVQVLQVLEALEGLARRLPPSSTSSISSTWSTSKK